MMPGAVVYVSPWWVDVVSYSPKAKLVRFRKLARNGAPVPPIERMGRIAFTKQARAA